MRVVAKSTKENFGKEDIKWESSWNKQNPLNLKNSLSVSRHPLQIFVLLCFVTIHMLGLSLHRLRRGKSVPSINKLPDFPQWKHTALIKLLYSTLTTDVFLQKNVSEKGRCSIINSNFLKWGVTNVVNMQRLVQCFSLTWFQLWLAIHEPRLTVLHPTNSTQCSLLSRWSMGMASHVYV